MLLSLRFRQVSRKGSSGAGRRNWLSKGIMQVSICQGFRQPRSPVCMYTVQADSSLKFSQETTASMSIGCGLRTPDVLTAPQTHAALRFKLFPLRGWREAWRKANRLSQVGVCRCVQEPLENAEGLRRALQDAPLLYGMHSHAFRADLLAWRCWATMSCLLVSSSHSLCTWVLQRPKSYLDC